MKKVLFFYFLILILLMPITASAIQYNYTYNNPIPDGYRPIVFTLNISNNTAFFGNGTHLNVSCQRPQCIDMNITVNNATQLDWWREVNLSSSTYGRFYINLTSNGSIQINTGANGLSIADNSSGNRTFSEFDDFNHAFVSQNWTTNTGTWSIVNGAMQVSCPGSANNCRALYNVANKSFNFTTIEINISHTASTTGILFVADTMTNDPIHNGYENDFIEGTSSLTIRRRDNGVGTTLGTVSTTALSYGVYYLHRVVRNDGVINTQASRLTTVGEDLVYRNGFTGIWCSSPASAQTCAFENFRVYPSNNLTSGFATWSNSTFSPPPPTPAPRVPFTPSNCGLKIIYDSQNMAPQFPGEPEGSGARVSGVTYWANDSTIELMVFAHAESVSQTTEIELFINSTDVASASQKPLGGAEMTNSTIIALIPRYSNYSVTFSNYHHYEWREYNTTLDISGCTYPQNNTSLNNVIQGISIGIGFIFGLIVAVAACKKHMDDHINKYHRR